MSYQYQEPVSDMGIMPLSESKIQEIFNAAMARVYLWMFLGLSLTAVIAYSVSQSETWINFIYSSLWVTMGLFIGQIALVIALVAAIKKLSTPMAIGMFFLYAALNGLTLSSIFLVYNLGTIFLAFGATASLFGVMSIIGWTTKSDLTKWGPILLMGLIGLIIGTVINMFLRSSAFDLILTYVGILIFLALIVYDTKYIKETTRQLANQGGEAMIGKIAVIGALKLYLDFVNLFLYILRLFGRK